MADEASSSQEGLVPTLAPQTRMRKACIVLVNRDAAAAERLARSLEECLGTTHRCLCFASAEEARDGIGELEAGEIALVLCDEASASSRGEALRALPARGHPGARMAILTDPASSTGLDARDLDAIIPKPWEIGNLVRTLRPLLECHALDRELVERRALDRAALALADCFDIDSILGRVADAAGELVGNAALEVFYAGWPAVNARARWYPAAPSAEHLCVSSRLRVATTLTAISRKRRGSGACWRGRILGGLRDGAGRVLVPFSYNGEIFGLTILKPRTAPGKVELELLEALGHHAGLALHGIHIAQERIQFERLAAFGQMIGSLVHDFRSPLTAIRGYAGMLGAREAALEERREYSRLAIEECDRLNNMIDELLELTRGNRARLNIRRILLGEYLAGLEPAIRAVLSDRPIRLEVKAEYRGPILLDPDRMSRAVLNVVANARQAMETGGVLVLRAARRGDRAVLDFQDTGCGIPDEIRHRIFEPFFSYGKAQGIGLGMTITKKIVEDHGGEVAVASSPADGTRVRFLLPIPPLDASEDLAQAGTACGKLPAAS